MSAELYIDDWEDIARRRGYRPEVLARARRARKAASAEAIAEKERTAALTILRTRFAPGWVVAIIMEAAREYGVSPRQVLIDGRVTQVVAARRAATYRIKAAKPMLSSPRIAKWMGRDHTSILHALASHAAQHGLPTFTRYNLARKRKS